MSLNNKELETGKQAPQHPAFLDRDITIFNLDWAAVEAEAAMRSQDSTPAFGHADQSEASGPRDLA
jgi:hypothetical protein